MPVCELLNTRQHPLVRVQFLADVEVAVQKSQMVLHMHAEKAIYFFILQFKTHIFSKESLGPLREACAPKIQNSFRKIEVALRDLRS